ncbi:unnamed protein product [Strongylus vulgaris]|uniref:DUF19 domain-containing protein n=1 Tax=Strongylus vulgaris TaxID=40348 RepID=A0A3P7KHB7_STRVU|nr:unnamed protein product [Strongylus vulgaris]
MDMLILIIVCQLMRLIEGSSSTLEQLCQVKPQSGLCQYNENENQNKGPNRTWTRLRDLSKDEQQFVRLARESGDDPSCKTLKTEYDQVCFTPPPAQAFQETKAFCDAFVETCAEVLKTNLFTHLTEIQVDFSEYCKQQKQRFKYVCPKPLRFRTYAEQVERLHRFYIDKITLCYSKLFFDGKDSDMNVANTSNNFFVQESAQRIMRTRNVLLVVQCQSRTDTPHDRLHRKLRAVDFCLRYTERCPKEKIPEEPVPFETEDETHIYIREIESRCRTAYRAARTFCLHPELLKYPKYAIPCAMYKADCIDVYRRVIYG